MFSNLPFSSLFSSRWGNIWATYWIYGKIYSVFMAVMGGRIQTCVMPWSVIPVVTSTSAVLGSSPVVCGSWICSSFSCLADAPGCSGHTHPAPYLAHFPGLASLGSHANDMQSLRPCWRYPWVSTSPSTWSPGLMVPPASAVGSQAPRPLISSMDGNW